MVLVETENNFFNFSTANVIVKNSDNTSIYFSAVHTFQIDESEAINLNQLEEHFKAFDLHGVNTYINLYNLQFIEEQSYDRNGETFPETVLTFYNGHQYRFPFGFKSFTELFHSNL